MSYIQRMPSLNFWVQAINTAILAATPGADVIHVIDLGLWSGQWPALIRQLAERTGQKSPPRLRLRITFIEAPPDTPNGIGPCVSAQACEKEVREAGNQFGIRVEVRVVERRLEEVLGSHLEWDSGPRGGQVLVVNCALRLSQMFDAQVVRSSPRDAFLKVGGGWVVGL